MKGVPDRWLQYRPVGDLVPGTRFIAFKVPLADKINSRVPTGKRLSASLLMEQVPNLGMVIDLTNTARYYSPRIFQDNGIEHRKIQAPGRKVPPNSLVDKFNQIVAQYLNSEENAGKLIGVHCTHGVNRAGFFICNYMVSKMNFNPKDAIRKFSLARGHGIERPQYIDALCQIGHYDLLDPASHRRESRTKSRSRSPNLRTKTWRNRTRSISKSPSRTRDLYETRKRRTRSLSPSQSLYKSRLSTNLKSLPDLYHRIEITESRSLSRLREKSRSISAQRYRYRNVSPSSKHNSSPRTFRSNYKSITQYNGHESSNLRTLEDWRHREVDKSRIQGGSSTYSHEDRRSSPLSWRRTTHNADSYDKSSKFYNYGLNNVEVMAIRPGLTNISRSRRRSHSNSREKGNYVYPDNTNTSTYNSEHVTRARNHYETNYRNFITKRSEYLENWRRPPPAFQRYFNNSQNSRYKWDRRNYSSNETHRSPSRSDAVGANNIEPVSFMAQRYGNNSKNHLNYY